MSDWKRKREKLAEKNQKPKSAAPSEKPSSTITVTPSVSVSDSEVLNCLRSMGQQLSTLEQKIDETNDLIQQVEDSMFEQHQFILKQFVQLYAQSAVRYKELFDVLKSHILTWNVPCADDLLLDVETFCKREAWRCHCPMQAIEKYIQEMDAEESDDEYDDDDTDQDEKDVDSSDEKYPASDHDENDVAAAPTVAIDGSQWPDWMSAVTGDARPNLENRPSGN